MEELRVGLGRDMRLSDARARRALPRRLLVEGADVVDGGEIGTGDALLLVASAGLDGGHVWITAWYTTRPPTGAKLVRKDADPALRG